MLARSFGSDGSSARSLRSLGAVGLFALALLAYGAPAASAAPPAVAITSATATGPREITVSGTVDPHGEEAVVYAEHSLGAGPFVLEGYKVIAQIPAGTSGATSVSGTIEGLEPETQYSIRLDAENPANGEVYSPEPYPLVTTPPPIPSARRSRATYVGTENATVASTLVTEEQETTYRIEYGPTTAYESSTPVGSPLAPLPDEQEVTVPLSGLRPATLYHARFVATNAAGTSNGPDFTFTTFSVRATGACPENEQFRVGPSAALPDCRAYEQVSPVDKNGANIQHEVGVVEAAASGDALSFALASGLPVTGESGNSRADYFGRRTTDGWATNSMVPLTEPGVAANLDGWDEELSTSIGEAEGPLFLGNLREGTYEQVVPSTPPIDETEQPIPDFAGDPKHFLLETEKQLVPGVPAGVTDLYEVDHGVVSLAALVPPGSATSCSTTCVPAGAGAFAGPYAWQSGDLQNGGVSELSEYYTENALSTNGSRIVFTARGDGKLYLREGGVTTWISAPETGVSDPNGQKPAAFVGATSDDSKIYFLSCEELTAETSAHSTASDSCTEPGSGTPNEQGQDLYLYEPGTEPGEGVLTDLTVDTRPGDSVGADVVGFLGASADGEDLYFAANGVLAPGASQGRCLSQPVSGQHQGVFCNIYVLDHGSTRFVTSIDSTVVYPADRRQGGAENWMARQPRNYEQGARSSRVSSNGVLLFDSTADLTGYNPDCELGEGVCAELYRYTPGDGVVNCVSCDPSGAPPTGNATLVRKGKVFTAAVLQVFMTRNLSADGNRVFFESPDPLVPEDRNTVTDPYEWEAVGTGSCSVATADGGCIYLLSSGEGSSPTFFGDASASGDDVFIFTSQSLVPADRDALTDAYDVRVGGGLPSQQIVPAVPCTGEACKPQPAGSVAEGSPGSSVFRGPGNSYQKPKQCSRQGKGKHKNGPKSGKATKQGCGKHQKHHRKKRPARPKRKGIAGVKASGNDKRGGTN
jgi:hypothetical protein